MTWTVTIGIGLLIGIGTVLAVSRHSPKRPTDGGVVEDDPPLLSELTTRENRLTALLEVSGQLGRLQRVESLLTTIAEACQHLFDSDSIAYRMVEGDELVLGGAWGSGGEVMLEKRVKLGESISGRVALTGEPLLVRDLEHDPRLIPEHQRAARELGHHGMLAVPVKIGERVAGVLILRTRRPQGFTSEDLSIAGAFASQVAIAMENARLYGDLARTNDRLRALAGTVYHRAEERTEKLTALSTLTRLINSASESDSVFNAVAKAAATLLHAKVSHVWIDDPASLGLTLQGRFSEEADHEPLPEEISFLAYTSGVETAVFESRTPEYIPDIQQDPRWLNPALARQAGLHAWAGIPMIGKGTAVGVLSLHFAAEREFSPEEEEKELMRLLADQAATAIENRRSAERLRVAHAQTEQLLASISWILIAVDEYDAITQWNQAAEKTFEIPAGKVVGWPLVDCGIDWDWNWVLDRVREARTRDHPTRFDPIRYRLDGKDRFLGITLTPIKGAPGQASGFLLLGSDITERKFLETQLAQAQRLEAIGRLAAGVAHEINTPIQFVGDNTRFLQTAFDDLHRLVRSYRGLCDSVKAGTATPLLLAELARAEQETDVDYLVGEIPKAVLQTLDGVTRVATIVQALKEFAHPDQKEKVAADLNQALLSTLSVARNEIKYIADVETDLGDLPLVVCQPGELNQVFLNLIVNAAHAIADGVRDPGTKGVIRVRTAREDDMVLIAITDTGCGIPEAHRTKIFDPFFTTKEVGRGTGQGLAIAHSVVVDKHGGSLTFETEIDRGTTFFIRLPIAGAEGKADP